MRKSRYVSLLLAGVAVTAMAGCDQNNGMKESMGSGPDSKIYGDVSTCANETDAAECTKAYEAAKDEHTKAAPKFANKAECEAAGYAQCEVAEVRTANGGTSSMFMPMMMGFLMSQFGGGMGGMGGMMAPPGGFQRGPAAGPAPAGPAPAARPVYADRNGYLYSGGGQVGQVAPGSTTLGNNGIAARSTTRGGFGASGARFSSGGS